MEPSAVFRSVLLPPAVSGKPGDTTLKNERRRENV
jgi:hypothetical protein